jgi:predicted Zn-dependent protease with MMP-like domain
VSDDDIDELLRGFDERLAGNDVAGAERALAKLRARVGSEHTEVLYAQARVTWLSDGPEAARYLFERVVSSDPEYADAVYDLGCVAEELADEQAMVECFLRVRSLDAARDRELGIGTDRDFTRIEGIAREVLDALPGMFTERMAHVPILIERRPSRALVQDGFDPRAFGLFEGPNDAERDTPAPTRIVIYACNLLAEFPEEPALSEEIELTVLHEVGHFFGLDEDDLTKLGLD